MVSRKTSLMYGGAIVNAQLRSMIMHASIKIWIEQDRTYYKHSEGAFLL